MGRGDWDHETYRTASVKMSSQTREQVFESRDMHPDMDPAKIKVRESRDSKAHPQSNAIIIAFDETGSMGHIPEMFVKKYLGNLMTGIFKSKPVTDPHIMVMGIGDGFGDHHPLQCSQFEADITIVSELKKVYLEGNGGGNDGESYDLAWYFAAAKTEIDCWDIRKKKGYLFTIGDEPPPTQAAPERVLKTAVGSESPMLHMQPHEALREAQKRYHVFHIVVEGGDYTTDNLDFVLAEWKPLLGKRVIRLNKAEYIAEVILAVIEVNEGAGAEAVIEAVEGKEAQAAVRHALFPDEKEKQEQGNSAEKPYQKRKARR